MSGYRTGIAKAGKTAIMQITALIPQERDWPMTAVRESLEAKMRCAKLGSAAAASRLDIT